MDDSGIAEVKLFATSPDCTDYSEVQGSRIDDFSYQFTFKAPQEAGSQFYVEIRDVNGNLTSTQEQPNVVYSGFISSGFDYEGYCNAYLTWLQTDLPGMDLPVTPPVVGSAFECMVQCVGNLSCQSFTWDDVHRILLDEGRRPAPRAQASCISGKEFTVPDSMNYHWSVPLHGTEKIL